jgi:hypothetical protein
MLGIYYYEMWLGEKERERQRTKQKSYIECKITFAKTVMKCFNEVQNKIVWCAPSFGLKVDLS